MATWAGFLGRNSRPGWTAAPQTPEAGVAQHTRAANGVKNYSQNSRYGINYRNWELAKLVDGCVFASMP